MLRIYGNEVNGYVVQCYVADWDRWEDLTKRYPTYDAASKAYSDIEMAGTDE